MRRWLAFGALALLPLAPAGAADDDADYIKAFRRSYRQEAAFTRRIEALRSLKAHDAPRSAEVYVEIWGHLNRKRKALQTQLLRARVRIRALAQVRDPRRMAEAATQLEAWKRKERSIDRLLTEVELESVEVVQGVGALKAEKTLDWLAIHGLRKVRETLLLRTVCVTLVAGGRADVVAGTLSRVRKPGQLVPLLQGLAHADGRADAAIAVISKLLQHRDASVRIAAARAMSAIPVPEAIPPLIRAMQKEAPQTKPMRELARALQILTRQKTGPFPGIWQRWWADNESGVRDGNIKLGGGEPVDEAGSSGERFYGLPPRKTVVFVLDVSGSMEVSMRKPKWVDGDSVPAELGEDSRLDAAKRQLLRSVKGLSKDARYTVVLYSDRAYAVWDKLMPANEKTRKELEERLEDLEPEGSTNIYDAMHLALTLAGVLEERKGEGAEAIFLVSDGSPTTSDGKVEDPKRTLFAVRDWNALQRAEIHTVGIGHRHNKNFLRALAKEHGGVYRAVVPSKKRR